VQKPCVPTDWTGDKGIHMTFQVEKLDYSLLCIQLMGLAVRFDTQKAVETERFKKCLWHIFPFKFFNFSASYFPEF
jgi:hypothetical protein